MGIALRSVGVLASGAAIAHVITALSMPVLTRLYTPQDFSAATVLNAILAIVSVVACLRLEVAIPLPADDEDAVNLLAMSACFAVGVALLTAVAVAVVPSQAVSVLGEPAVAAYLWLLPVGVAGAGLYLIGQMWFTRRARFGILASNRVIQSGGAASAQLGLGLAGSVPFGLMLGQVINFVIGGLGLGLALLRRDRKLLSNVRWSRMRAMLVEYQKFPRFSVPEALANTGAIQLPVLLIAAFAAGPEAGYLGLAMFALQAPMALLGNAIGQVFFAEAAVAHREGRLSAYTLATLQRLIPIILAPAILAAIVAPPLCSLVFGPEWERTGILIAWMMPWFLLQFLASPISTVLHVVGRQQAAMVLQLFGLVLRVGSVLAAGLFASTLVSEVYALSGGILYGAYLVIVMRAAHISPGRLVPILRRQLPWIALALVGGGVAALCLDEIANVV